MKTIEIIASGRDPGPLPPSWVGRRCHRALQCRRPPSGYVILYCVCNTQFRSGSSFRRRGGRDGRRRDPTQPRALWGRAQRPRRGPQPALSLGRIVAAAIKIADAEGIHALSMARLAQRLGCAPMSLYRHVANKEELQVFMMDTAPGAPPVIDLPARDWRRGLERWARELQAVYYRHPWILQITTGRPPLEPGQLAWLDCGLRILRGHRSPSGPEAVRDPVIVNYVRGEAQITAVMLETLKRSEVDNRQRQDWYGRTLARLVDAERFPALAELIAAGTFEQREGCRRIGRLRLRAGRASSTASRGSSGRAGARSDAEDVLLQQLPQAGVPLAAHRAPACRRPGWPRGRSCRRARGPGCGRGAPGTSDGRGRRATGSRLASRPPRVWVLR